MKVHNWNRSCSIWAVAHFSAIKIKMNSLVWQINTKITSWKPSVGQLPLYLSIIEIAFIKKKISSNFFNLKVWIWRCLIKCIPSIWIRTLNLQESKFAAWWWIKHFSIWGCINRDACIKYCKTRYLLLHSSGTYCLSNLFFSHKTKDVQKEFTRQSFHFHLF